MKTVYFIGIFLLFVNTSCKSQELSLNEKRESDHFLKWFLQTRKEKIVSTKVVQLSINNLARIKEVVKISKKDSITIHRQIDENNKSQIDSLVPDKIFLQKIGWENTFLKISKPIFFDKGKKLWIFVEHYCPDTCGEGEIMIFDVKDNTYTLIHVIDVWIS